jgi:site-specific DNA recombinase
VIAHKSRVKIEAGVYPPSGLYTNLRQLADNPLAYTPIGVYNLLMSHTYQQGEAGMIATGYSRVSTPDQAEDGVSLGAQKARIAAWCIANDVELSEVHVDAGMSGKRADNRPSLQAALDSVCATSGVLVVYSLSRLARSTRDTLAIAERLDKAGANLVSLSERIDTTSAAGKMMFRMLAVLAEFERDQISERTKGAMAHKKAKGERVGQIPFGKMVDSDGVMLVDCPLEQEAIAIVRQLRVEGMPIRAIADEMNRRGVPTKGEGRWHIATVQRVLKAA